MAKSRKRIKGRFFLMILILVGFIALVVVVANALKKTGEIEFGSLGADLEINAAVIRDEKVIMSEPY